MAPAPSDGTWAGDRAPCEAWSPPAISGSVEDRPSRKHLLCRDSLVGGRLTYLHARQGLSSPGLELPAGGACRAARHGCRSPRQEMGRLTGRLVPIKIKMPSQGVGAIPPRVLPPAALVWQEHRNCTAASIRPRRNTHCCSGQSSMPYCAVTSVITSEPSFGVTGIARSDHLPMPALWNWMPWRKRSGGCDLTWASLCRGRNLTWLTSWFVASETRGTGCRGLTGHGCGMRLPSSLPKTGRTRQWEPANQAHPLGRPRAPG